MALINCTECGKSVSPKAAACPNCGAPIASLAAAARVRSKNSSRTKVLLALVAIPVLLVMCNRGNDKPPAQSVQPVISQTADATKKLEQQKIAENCAANREEQLAQFRKLALDGKQWEAAIVIRRCAQVLDDAAMKSMVVEAEQKSHMQQMVDTKERSGVRLIAINRLKADYPDFAASNAGAIAKAEAKAHADAKAEERRAEAEQRAERRKRGVSIGMTQEEVLQSSWGKPEDINRSTYSFGVHEQWVYGGGNYLYFENGKLTSIQN